jgi:superfamily II DNA/RNA helicase
VQENAREIRDKVLQYLMVRRTRSEIEKYFGEDLKAQKLRFPEVRNPEPVFYELNDEENEIFIKTIELITKDFKYARYMPLIYYKGEDASQPEVQAQRNLGKFMKILMVKRLESSFYAFRNTLERFINSYEHFIKEFDKGNVYVSKKYSAKIFEFLENDNDVAIQRLVDEDRAQRYAAKDFTPEFKKDLESDLATLKEISKMWQSVKRDPKLLKFIDVLLSNPILKENKIIIFTESKETAEYLGKNLGSKFPDQVLTFTGGSNASTREKVTQNFDAKVRFPKDDYRILVATEVLAEGVNLHRSNTVINYDIPWNPTRLMQRVGRINRVDTKFDIIYSFNFFPTQQANDQIKLKEAAEAKIQAFIQMLGTDAQLLTEGEAIESFSLFNRLTSSKTITGEGEEEDSELKYLQIIRNIRDNDPELFEKIKRLPKKARTARANDDSNNAALTYFRKGKLHKFYLSSTSTTDELDFFTAAKVLEADESIKRDKLGKDFYDYLKKNKEEFENSTIEELPEVKMRGGRDSSTIILRMLKSNEMKYFPKFTDEDEHYIKEVIRLIEEGGLPKQTTKTLVKELSKETNPMTILAKLKFNIAENFFIETPVENAAQTAGPREVILSEYLAGNKTNG